LYRFHISIIPFFTPYVQGFLEKPLYNSALCSALTSPPARVIIYI
jgi:hypothetical protein